MSTISHNCKILGADAVAVVKQYRGRKIVKVYYYSGHRYGTAKTFPVCPGCGKSAYNIID